MSIKTSSEDENFVQIPTLISFLAPLNSNSYLMRQCQLMGLLVQHAFQMGSQISDWQQCWQL